jgi:hypothetical protein
MPGTVVRDALAPDLIDDGIVELSWTGEIQFVLEGDGSTSGYSVTVQGADNAAFDSNVVDIVHFTGVGASETHQITTYLDKRYVRVAAAAGTAGGVTLTPVLPHDRRVRSSFGA